MRITRDNTQFMINHLFELPTENTELGPIVFSFLDDNVIGNITCSYNKDS